MVKTIVALLVLLLVLVGPASAQEPEPSAESSDDAPGEEPAGSEDQDASKGSEEPSDVGSDKQDGKTCRVVATHIADPKVAPHRWVIPDPDGCFRRTIDRLIPPFAGKIVDRIL